MPSKPKTNALRNAFIFSLPNDLPFSSERQGRLRAYHGREEPTSERPGAAFVCCNGLLVLLC
jgi:hypothetical protein